MREEEGAEEGAEGRWAAADEEVVTRLLTALTLLLLTPASPVHSLNSPTPRSGRDAAYGVARARASELRPAARERILANYGADPRFAFLRGRWGARVGSREGGGAAEREARERARRWAGRGV